MSLAKRLEWVRSRIRIRRWYAGFLPLALLTSLSIAAIYGYEISREPADILIPRPLDEKSLSKNEYTLRGLTAAAQPEHFSVTIETPPRNVTVVRFAARPDGFDFVRLSASPGTDSGFFTFRDGREAVGFACPALPKNTTATYRLSFSPAAVELAGEGVDCRWTGREVRGPFVFSFFKKGFFRPPERNVRDFQNAAPEPAASAAGKERRKSDFLPILKKGFLIGATVDILAALYHSLLLRRLRKKLPRLALPLAYLLGAISTAALIGLYQLGDRWREPAPWYEPFVEYGKISEKRADEATVIHNGDCDYSLAKQTPFRIVVMGGSSTAGDPYPACHPVLYASLLQQMFDEPCGPGRRTVEVVNLGQPADSLSRRIEENIEKIVLPRMQPDVLVIDSVINNAVSEKTLFDAVKYYRRRQVVGDRFFGQIADPRTLNAFEQSLQRIVDRSRSRGVKIVLVEEPIDRGSFAGDNPFQAMQKKLAEVAERNRVVLVRTQEDFDRQADQFLFFDFVHLTAWGNRLLGEKIFAAIRDNRLLADFCPPAGESANP